LKVETEPVQNLLEILGRFEGIIGALLGVALTFLLTEYLKRLGKLNFYITQKEVKFKVNRQDGYGQVIIEDAEEKESANFFQIDVAIEIHNSSDTPNILRDVKLSFYDNQQCKLTVIPEDKTTERFVAASYRREEFRHTNIKPKEITSLFLVYYFNKEQVEVIKGCNKVFLEAKSRAKKQHKVLLEQL